MKKQKLILFVVALLMMFGTVGLLGRFGAIQKLGEPGVKTKTLEDSANLEVILPEIVLDYTSERFDQPQVVIDTLPKDTSFGQRIYKAPDGFAAQTMVVLMGSDRTSIHKPQVCLTGSGWNIDYTISSGDTIHIDRPVPYDLPVMKLISTKTVEKDGVQTTYQGIYVYWFVADGAYTNGHWQRMWWMAKNLFEDGILQRWAYVSYFSYCRPGQEQQTFERMKKLIAASVPEFQLTPKSGKEIASSQP